MSLMVQWVIWMVRAAVQNAANSSSGSSNGSGMISSMMAGQQQQVPLSSFSQVAR
jgi:hypothetical protein